MPKFEFFSTLHSLADAPSVVTYAHGQHKLWPKLYFLDYLIKKGFYQMTRGIRLQTDPEVVDQNNQIGETTIYQLSSWC